MFVNATEIHKFTAKDSEIISYNLCLGNVSKVFSASNMKNTGSNGYIFHYNLIDVNDIKNIHKYLMKKNNIV